MVLTPNRKTRAFSVVSPPAPAAEGHDAVPTVVAPIVARKSRRVVIVRGLRVRLGERFVSYRFDSRRQVNQLDLCCGTGNRSGLREGMLQPRARSAGVYFFVP